MSSEAALGRLVRIGGRADRDRLALPRSPAELAPEHVGDVRLHPDRAPVAVVGGPVGSLLEVADVAEGAAMDAAHVRVQRPLERHAANGVQGGPARFEPVLGAHRAEYRTYVRIERRAARVATVDELDGGIRRVTLPLPTRPGHVHAYLLPGDDGWIVVDTGVGHARTRRTPGAPSSSVRAGRVAARLRHPLPPGSRRGRRRPARADRRARLPGDARLRAVRARVGEPELVGAPSRLVPAARRPRRRDGGARRPELALPALHPLPARSRARRGGGAAGRLGARRRSRPRRRPALPRQGRRPHRRRSPAAEDHPDRRALAGEPCRSARRLPGCARRMEELDAARRAARARRSDRRIPQAARASSRSTIACGWRRRSRRSARSRGRVTSSRSRSSGTT